MELRQHLGGEDLFKAVDSKVKAAVTREFNSGSHAMKVVVPKGKKCRAATDVDELAEGPDADEDGGAPPADGDEDSGDDVAASGLIKVKAKAKAKAKGKAKAKAKAAAGGGADEAPDAAAPRAKGRAKAKARR